MLEICYLKRFSLLSIDDLINTYRLTQKIIPMIDSRIQILT